MFLGQVSGLWRGCGGGGGGGWVVIPHDLGEVCLSELCHPWVLRSPKLIMIFRHDIESIVPKIFSISRAK